MPNPFSARHLVPGRLRYQFPSDELERQFWQAAGGASPGQIVGPHGSGKSTLMATMAAELRGGGLRVHHWRTLPADRRASWRCWPWSAVAAGDLVLLDGFDGWSVWQRGLIARRLRRRQCRWIVTSHRDLGLVTLWRTQVTVAVAERIVRLLLGRPHKAIPWTEGQLEAMLAARGGNLRELVFTLYDWFESAASPTVAALAPSAEPEQSLPPLKFAAAPCLRLHLKRTTSET